MPETPGSSTMAGDRFRGVLTTPWDGLESLSVGFPAELGNRNAYHDIWVTLSAPLRNCYA